jgi:hypothetical protein
MSSRAGAHRDRFAMPRPLRALIVFVVLLIAAGCREDAPAQTRSTSTVLLPGGGRVVSPSTNFRFEPRGWPRFSREQDTRCTRWSISIGSRWTRSGLYATSGGRYLSRAVGMESDLIVRLPTKPSNGSRRRVRNRNSCSCTTSMPSTTTCGCRNDETQKRCYDDAATRLTDLMRKSAIDGLSLAPL